MFCSWNYYQPEQFYFHMLKRYCNTSADKNYELHLITNGFEKIQHSKLKNSGLDGFFKEVDHFSKAPTA